MGNAMEMLDVAPLEGVVGWHRSMIGSAAGGVLGGVVGGEGLGLIGVGSPLGRRGRLAQVDDWWCCR